MTFHGGVFFKLIDSWKDYYLGNQRKFYRTSKSLLDSEISKLNLRASVRNK